MTSAVLYGSENLKIENVDIPTLAPDEALIRVKVALTCGTDLKVWKRGYHARMITPPAVFGHELAGIVETLGSDVNGGLKVGARVVPSNSAPCNVCLFCRKGQTNLCEDLLFNNGAYAEYIRIPGGTVNLFGGCSRGTQVQVDPNTLHYSEITIKSTFHHTPHFIREALEAIARGEIRSSDFVNAEIPLTELPKMFEHMKNRNGEMKVAVIP